jgi:DNA end-binding protein Ku
MARPIWTGVVSFGLVSVPVAMYTATSEHEVSFHQFERDTTDRIRYKRVNERTGKEVEFADIVKGADVGGGKYVMVDPEELDAVAPGRSRSLGVHAFVELSDIDPVYFQKTYYLAPGNDETKKTYALLRDAMAESGRAAIGTLVMRGKEYLVTVRPEGDLLVLHTMFFADEVRDPHEELDRLPGKVKLSAKELTMAGQLIDAMSGPWKPTDYRDTYTDRVNELIKAKKKGAEFTMADEAPEATGVADLMEVLRRSVENANSGRGGARQATKKATKRAAKATGKASAEKATAKKDTAKKSTAKKSTAKKTAKTTAKKSTATKTAKKATARKAA